jgi:lysozyme family protein
MGLTLVEQIIEHIIKLEGGFSDHPKDPGGRTNMGITQTTYNKFYGEGEKDVKDLSKAEAIAFYKQYLHVNGVLDITSHPGIAAVVCDITVNSGKRTAIRILQRAINNSGGFCVVDGLWGIQTKAALENCSETQVMSALLTARLDFYSDIIEVNPNLEVFRKGWANRARSVHEFAKCLSN